VENKQKLHPSFLLLSIGLIVLFLLTLVFLWYFQLNGETIWADLFFIGISLVFSLFVLIVLLGFLGMGFLFFRKKVPPFLIKPLTVAISTFMGFVVRAGKKIGLSQEHLERNYVHLVNKLNEKMECNVLPEKLLVLIPHCIQNAHCSRKITYDYSNCVDCGLCQLGEIIKLQEEKGFQMAVVSGGTAARQEIKKKRPEGIVAVACERDLMSGIQDVFPHPVLGVVNVRPEGPCLNTQVCWQELKMVINKMCRGVE